MNRDYKERLTRLIRRVRAGKFVRRTYPDHQFGRPKERQVKLIMFNVRTITWCACTNALNSVGEAKGVRQNCSKLKKWPLHTLMGKGRHVNGGREFDDLGSPTFWLWTRWLFIRTCEGLYCGICINRKKKLPFFLLNRELCNANALCYQAVPSHCS